jgi:hypothetical protein
LNESTKLDFMGSGIGTDAAGSIEVLSSSRNARITIQITDAVTGQTKSLVIATFSAGQDARMDGQ